MSNPLRSRHLSPPTPLPQSGAARLVGPDGISPASDPLLTSLMYDPSAPYGGRWRALDRDAIPRTYHAATCLHHTGEVLVAGCESCGGFVSTVGAGWERWRVGGKEGHLEQRKPFAECQLVRLWVPA